MPSSDTQSVVPFDPIYRTFGPLFFPTGTAALVVDAWFEVYYAFEDVTLVEVVSETDTGTADFDLELRAKGALETTGTAMTSADIQAVDGATTTLAFSNAFVPAGRSIVAYIRAVSAATMLSIKGALTRTRRLAD